ncbi:organic solvent tolerance protein OstA [Halosquirtibacter laminarini]|uniref:Organic solvent tolerance protein OstA n=1 Tax=Halosquirtibacter laminarini TaxID=3374600 RepID=A0AC61NG10_9BACT|nr:organic solvent tolerance protein OstA [Prolixibacteraceae bacterium]
MRHRLRLLCLFVSLTLFTNVDAQKRRVYIDHSDSLVSNVGVAHNADRLIGNVIVRHQGAIMHCDSAYFYSKENRVDAFGRIHITQGDTLNLKGNSLAYDGNTSLAIIRGDVKLKDPSLELTTDLLEYNLENGVAFYTTGGTIVDSLNTLKSKIGRYYSNDKMLFFKDSVELDNKDFLMFSDTLKYNTEIKTVYISGPTTINSDSGYLYSESGWYSTITQNAELYKNSKMGNKKQELRCDTLLYDKLKGRGIAHHHVEIEDFKSRLVIKGEYGKYHEFSKKGMVTKSALLLQYDKKDTLYLHADTLRTQSVADSIPDKKIFLAYNRVRFYRRDMQGVCDSLTYSAQDSVMRMYFDPIVWAMKNQMTADSITYANNNKGAGLLNLYGKSFMVSLDTLVLYNQISGKNMIGYIVNNKLDRLDVNGNGQTVYYVKDKEGMVGVNKAICSDIRIKLKNNKIDRISFIESPKMDFFPPGDFGRGDLKLPMFRWEEALRPKNPLDVFNFDSYKKEEEIIRNIGESDEQKNVFEKVRKSLRNVK